MNSTIARATGLGIGIGLVTVTTVAASTTPPPTQEEMAKIEQPVLIESVPPLDGWHCDALGCTPERPEDRPPLTPQEQADVDAEGEQATDCDTFECNDAADPNRHAVGYVQAEDGSWVPESYYDAPDIDVNGDTDTVGEVQETVPPAVIHEDDPRWDCRTMGNRECGVQIGDTWYVITFGFGTSDPIAVRTR